MSEPPAVSLRQLKREIADCLIYLPAHLASFLEDDIKAVQALIVILHSNLITAREDKKKVTAAQISATNCNWHRSRAWSTDLTDHGLSCCLLCV